MITEQQNNILSNNMLPVGTLLQGGKYRIERYLSSGGFGNTYVAKNLEFEEEVAIKEFFMRGISERDDDSVSVSISNESNAEQFTGQKDKFKKEARRLRRLKDNHIVAVHDLFEENGTAYYVMDFISGESISSRIKRTGQPISESEALRIIDQILNALDAVHKHGIYHLDIKPGNIMLDKDGRALLIDFGASKQMKQEGGATTSTGLCYTPGYAPIEQMEQNMEKFGPWTDIYALGASLYYMLTMHPLPSPTDIQEEGASALPMPNVSKKTQQLVLRMMKPMRNERPQSISEVRTLMFANPQCEETRTAPLPRAPQEETVAIEQPKSVQVPPPSRPMPRPSYTPPAYANKSKGLLIALVVGICIALLVAVVGVGALLLNKNSNTDSGQGNPVRVETLLNSPSDSSSGGIETYTVGNIPIRMVRVVQDGHSYQIGETEVTQELWEYIMGNNPSSFKGSQRPVESISWYDCLDFITLLNKNSGQSFRLPTLAEWKYAASGGGKGHGYDYAGSDYIEDVAWYNGNSGKKTHNIGSKQANELGCYDMSGNVWEWCQDEWNDGERVYCGGSGGSDPEACQVISYKSTSPSKHFADLGFRLAK